MSTEPTPERRARAAMLESGRWDDVFEILANDEPAIVAALTFAFAPNASIGWDDVELEDATYVLGDAIVAAGLWFGAEGAQGLVDAATRRSGVNVAEAMRLNGVVAAANETIERPESSIAECVAALRTIPESHPAREGVIRALARRPPITELLAFETFEVGERDALAPFVRARIDARGALRALFADGGALPHIARAIATFWPVHAADEGEVATLARVLLGSTHPVSELLDYLEPSAIDPSLLATLRMHALRAPIAALALLERRGFAPIRIARTLADAGYEDEAILDALRTNGMGTLGSLTVLQSAGWSAERMTDSLFAADASLTEIRDHLADLGVPREAIVELLSRHASIERVHLVCS